MPVATSALITYALCPTCTGTGGTAATPVNLNDLLDVTLTAPLTNGMTLQYDGLGQWRNVTVSRGCQLFELGGAGSVLALNDGLGVPNPVATDWTLQADSLHAVATVAPATSALTFQVRLMPGSVTISTGTIAIGQNIATFTPYVALAFADGQWVETVVTAADGTAAELTVTGELCGPGSGAAATLPTLSATFTQAVASTSWSFAHGLTFTPGGARFEDLAGNDLIPDNVTINATTVAATFIAAQAGRVTVS